MNRERHRYWSAYIADVQGRMMLGNWLVVLRREVPPAGPHAVAQVVFRPGTREVTVYICDNFEDFTRAEQRRIIVHELVHLHLQPLKFHLFKQGGGDDKDEYERIEVGHSSHEEYAVDDLARIIAPSMPLPPKVKP